MILYYLKAKLLKKIIFSDFDGMIFLKIKKKEKMQSFYYINHTK